jgi:hypothetical protein
MRPDVGKRKHKKNSELLHSQTKKETSVNDTTPHKNLLTDAIAHARSDGWIQGVGVGFLLTCIGLATAIMTSKDVKTAAISFALAGTVFVWMLAAVIIRYVKEAGPELTFSILQSWFNGTTSPDDGFFWVRYGSSLGDTLSPASASIFVTITNPRNSPAHIENLELDVQKKGDPWVPLRFIPDEGNRLYWIHGDFTKSTLIEVASLDKEVHSSIPAGETVSGWVFWSVTVAVPLSLEDEIRWRLRAKDSGGEESEYTSPYGPWTNKPKFDTAMKQPILIKPISVEDLSAVPRRHYEPFSN